MFDCSKETARRLDSQDSLARFRDAFHFPLHGNKPVIYFCGHSLGLQPRRAAEALQEELQSWQQRAVQGYFEGKNPWLWYQEYVKPPLARIMGALPDEITVMNALTVNLHLMMLSFYRPAGKKNKILMEAGAFPSDQYAVETQVRHYGLNPDEVIIEVAPREGERTWREEDIIAEIDKHKGELALVLLSGIHYYTGQFFNMAAITAAAHRAGAYAGWDLAHVAGNIPVQLHNWNVDFAVWCSYKYLNAGPGAVGGAFVHERHLGGDRPRLAGWWGNDEKTRFQMQKGFVPKPTASGWNLSTAQVFNTAALKASLEIFEEAGMENLRSKSVQLTAYLAYLVSELPHLSCTILTPSDPEKRGAQLSLYFPVNGRAIHQKLAEQGIVTDYREPGVVRAAPAPLYCSFGDVFAFYETIRQNF